MPQKPYVVNLTLLRINITFDFQNIIYYQLQSG